MSIRHPVFSVSAFGLVPNPPKASTDFAVARLSARFEVLVILLKPFCILNYVAILVFAAHPDDEVIGAGGTIAKFTREGEEVISIIFSYGEGSDPTKEPESLIQERVKESKKAGGIIGTKDVFFLGLSDLKFTRDASQPATKKKVHDILTKYKPKKLFTHSTDDLHPAHRAVAQMVRAAVTELKLKAEIYSFTISMPLKFVRRDTPRILIDVTKTFDLKLRALKAFKSQRQFLSFYFIPLIRIQAWLAGFKARCKYAEVFYKW